MFESSELSPVGAKSEGQEIIDIKEDIVSRSKNVPGASKVLKTIYENLGEEVYKILAPKLGEGADIWIKYKDECGGDLGDLVLKYGGGKKRNL